MIDRGGALRWLFWPSLILSIALHIGAIAVLYLSKTETPGAVDLPTTAISINLETTDILDAPEQSEATAAAAGQAAPPEEEKLAEEKPEETPKEPEPAQEEPKPVEAEQPPPESQPEQTAQEQPQPDDAAERERERIAEEALRKAEAEEAERREAARKEAERREAERREAERREEERKEAERKAAERREIERKEAEIREAERQERQEREAEAREERQRAERAERRKEARERARQRRQSGASGSQGAKSSKGRVSASRGSIRNYASMVRSRIARNKPGGRSGSGRVVISFALSASGSLISARVVSSSGNASLDQSALSAVRQSSPFPAPPAGSSSSQLRFTMPFQFR
jgi:colicin import membrane protein